MSILQYLTTYAEPECRCLPDSKQYAQVLVVPAFDEHPSMLDSILKNMQAQQDLLCIVVINSNTARSQSEQCRTNYLVSALTAGAETLSLPNITRSSRSFGDLLVIDRASPPYIFDEKQGVGLARKIGCDLALTWHQQGVIKSPWIHCTDADAVLPDDYFHTSDSLAANQDIAAICYPFWHNTSKSLAGRALEYYEMSLRYYVLGLHWACSPYAFHTIGSTIAIRAKSYYQVRGIPKRQAGEDFYLLNKIAKIGAIVTPTCNPIVITERSSQRTPFGTGPATNKINNDLKNGKDFLVYHPTSFALLREWIAVLVEFSHSGNLTILDTLSYPELKRALPLDTEKQLRASLSQCKTTEARKRRLFQWFDGFRTLKLLHALRDQGFEDQPMQLAFDTAPFVPNRGTDLDLRQTMIAKEKKLNRTNVIRV